MSIPSTRSFGGLFLRAALSTGVTASLVTLSGGLSPAFADDDPTLSSFDAQVRVGEDGAVHVREALSYDFGTGGHDTATRTIPQSGSIDGGDKRSFGLTNVEVEDAGGVAPVDIADNAWLTASVAVTHGRA